MFKAHEYYFLSLKFDNLLQYWNWYLLWKKLDLKELEEIEEESEASDDTNNNKKEVKKKMVGTHYQNIKIILPY